MEDKLQTNNNTPSDQNQIVTPKVEEAAPATSDRTREQFEKLTTSNSTLNEENARLRRELEAAHKPAEPAPREIEPARVPQNLPKEIELTDFVETDPKTGEKYVNETRLKATITELQSKTTKAEETIQSYIKTNEDRRIQQQKDEAFTAYPELRPEGEKFDKKFYKTVRAVLYDSMMNADEYGRTLSLKEAADYVKKEIVPTPPVKEEEKEEKKEISDAKAQAGTLVPSQPQNAPTPTVSDELKRLRLATRQGNIDALAQRILATDHVKS